MFGKTCLFFLVACVALQINVNEAKSIRIKPLTRVVKPLDIIDDGEEILDNLEAKVKKIVDSAISSLESDLRSFEEITGYTQETGDGAISNVEGDLIADLNAIKQKAEDDGLDITSCLGANEDELLGVGNKARELADKCTTKSYNNQIENLKDTEDEIQQYSALVASLRKQFRRCPTDDCRTQIIDVVKNIYYDNIEIWIDAEVILQLMNTSLNESIFSSCYVEAVFDVYNGNDILNTIEQCVNDLK